MSGDSTNIFSKAARFYGEVKNEGRRVTWPSRRETLMTAAMVFVLAIIASIFFTIVDQVASKLLKFIIN